MEVITVVLPDVLHSPIINYENLHVRKLCIKNL